MKVFADITLYIIELINIFYKIAAIITLFFATKALRIYIENASKKK